MRTTLSIIAVLALLGPAACADRADDPATVGEEPVYGGTLVIAAPNELDVANPLVSREAYTSEILRYLLFMPLIRYGDEMRYRPYLARSWEMKGDTAVVFHLREDVYWHDGVQTTAYDVAFTFRRAMHPKTAYPGRRMFAHWTGIEVVDSFTVRFAFEPHLDPLAGVPLLPIVPKHLLEDVPPAEMRRARFNRHPVGNGPFRFVEHVANDRWVFAANPAFPEELGGRPYLDRVVWHIVPENSVQVVELLTGRADMILAPRVEQIEALAPRDDIRVFTRPSRKYLFIGWNGLREPFDDPRVRRALTMAIDRREIVEVLRGGYGTLAVGPIGPRHWAYKESLEPLPYAPERAERLLAEAGIRNRDGDGALEHRSGREFRFTLKIAAQNSFQRDVAEMIRADLASIGIHVETRPTEFTTLIGDLTSPERRFDAALMGWKGDVRVNLRGMFHSDALGGPYQFASYSNPEVDRLLDRLAEVSTRAEARPLLHRVQEILHREQPWTFLYYYPAIGLYRERVRGVEMDIRGLLATLPRWWIADAPQRRRSPRPARERS